MSSKAVPVSVAVTAVSSVAAGVTGHSRELPKMVWVPGLWERKRMATSWAGIPVEGIES